MLDAPDDLLIVGVTGLKRAGKDTFAEGLVRSHGFRRLAFADALKDAALAADPVIGRYPYPHVAAPSSDVHLSTYVATLGWEDAKEIPAVRTLLQRLGVAMREVDPLIWVRPVLREAARSAQPVVVTDVRFRNEADAIREVGGAIIRVERPGQVADDPHVSEQEMLDYPADLTVLNDGTADDLRLAAAMVVTAVTP